MTNHDSTQTWEDINPFPAETASQHPKPTQAKESLFDEIVANQHSIDSAINTSTLSRRQGRVWRSAAVAATIVTIVTGGVYVTGQTQLDVNGATPSEAVDSPQLPAGLDPVDPNLDITNIESGVMETTTAIIQNGQTTREYYRISVDGPNEETVFDTNGGGRFGPQKPIWNRTTLFNGVEYVTDSDGNTVGYETGSNIAVSRDEFPVAANREKLVDNLARVPDYVETELEDGWVIHTGTIERDMNMFEDHPLYFIAGPWEGAWTIEPAAITVVESYGVVVQISMSVDSPEDGRLKRSLVGTSTMTFSGLGEPQDIQPPPDAVMIDQER